MGLGEWEKRQRGDTEPGNHVRKFVFHPKSHRKPSKGFKQTNDMGRVFKRYSDGSVETG